MTAVTSNDTGRSRVSDFEAAVLAGDVEPDVVEVGRGAWGDSVRH
jgi:hypothetical protein